MSQPTVKARILRLDTFGLAACLALTAGAYFVGVEPVLNARARTEEKRRFIEEQSRNTADAEELITRERARLEQRLREHESSTVTLASPSELNRRLGFISDLLARHGLSVQHLEPGAPTTDPDLGRFTLVPIRMTGFGPFRGMRGFLSELAGQYRDIEVRSLSLADQPATENLGRRQAAFTIELRWFAAPAASADARTGE